MIDSMGGVMRSREDRWFLGVCGGIAHHFGWRPNTVRLVTAILAIAIPGPSLVAALLVYAALGAILPESDEF